MAGLSWRPEGSWEASELDGLELVALVAVVALLAAATVALLVLTVRRSARAADGIGPGRAADRHGGAQPALGGKAQVWVSRGEQALADLRARAEGRTMLDRIIADAEQVVVELRDTAVRVTELNRALAVLPVERLRGERDRLTTAMAEAAGKPLAADLAAAHGAVCAHLATVGRQQAAKDALLARMHAAVAGLEKARSELTELTELLADEIPHTPEEPGSAACVTLAEGVAGLRAGLVEVRRLSAAALDPGPQGIHRYSPGPVEAVERT